MNLMFFPVNNAWAFIIGRDVRFARPLQLDSFPLFFQTREEAVEAARVRGLVVSRYGRVVAPG